MPIKPTKQEEAFFIKAKFEGAKKVEDQRQYLLNTEERLKLKELHYMRCPKCGMQLVEIDYRGIKIDKCTVCDGVWLDAGEMDMIMQLERSSLVKLFELFA